MNNFTNNRWLPVVVILLLAANIVTLILLWTNKKPAGITHEQDPPPRGQVFEFISRELDLDAAQQEIYKKLREEHQAGVRDIRENIQRKAKEQLFELLKKPNVSDSEIQVYSGKAAAADQQIDVFTFHHFQKLRAICKPAQQEKFDEIIQEALRRMGPARRPGPPPGGEDGPPH